MHENKSETEGLRNESHTAPIGSSNVLEEIKKKFYEKFGDKHGIHIPSNEIWEFFYPHLTKKWKVTSKDTAGLLPYLTAGKKGKK